MNFSTLAHKFRDKSLLKGGVFLLFLMAVVFVYGMVVLSTPSQLAPDGGLDLFHAVQSSAVLSLMVVLTVLPVIRRLRQHSRNAEMAIDSTNDGYWVLDAEGRFLDVNHGYSRMMGYTRAELMTMRIADFEEVATHEQIRSQIRRILLKGNDRFETRHRHRTGSWVDLEITVTVVEGRYLVAFLRDISERKLAQHKIHDLAFLDPLTGLPNRRLLQDRLEQAVASSVRTQNHGAVLFVDLDNFKVINDTRGHAVGDLLLVKVAKRLLASVSPGDTVARLGGDEFVLVVEALSADPIEAALQAQSLAERCRQAVERPYTVGENEFYSSASIGVAMFCGGDVSFGELLQRADTAMYQGKFGGRNRVAFFEPQMQRELAQRTELEADLRRALSAGQFLIYLQPQVNFQGKITGAEVLLRWSHPTRGLVSPQTFITLAEENGLIVSIGTWVLSAACDILRQWHQSPLGDLQLSVNVSAVQFARDEFVSDLAALLTRTGVDPRRLKLELTESAVVQNIDDLIDKMLAIRALGVSLAMDDFGTGQSSLTNLRRLPVQQLKIDQSFVRHLHHDASDLAIVRTIIAMSGALGLEVVAEGVETQAQQEVLAQHGCLAYQGLLFGAPVPQDVFQAQALPGIHLPSSIRSALPN
ncbi:MAG: hypothetical protein RLZZ591_1607 [Pseudomonadota bacterium]|jgi:diguanylate cyclase (GGDEF)-like protein/PAS domain S-box-containing protein